MRVFVALDLPQKTKDNLERSSNQFAEHSNGGNFVPKENFHITLHFLGNVAASDLIYIQSAMDAVKDMPAPEIAVTQFVMQRSNDIVWAKLKQNADLVALHDTLGEKLENNGFEVEHRAFRAHITLIRKKSFTLPWTEVVKNVKVYNMPFVATNVVLYESVFGENGVTYRELYKVTLRTNARGLG
ncbi:MAG: RNA 2',3'-cyclic phosphodiesterase [Clostridiales bacterium]|nr:RNA 2',3'-cyclic phosphodiesterase [Clostridiales bacterium]